MAQQLYFSRDSKMWIEFDGVVWEVPVLDGFSFSQSTNSSEITLAEMESSAGVSRRGRRAFNDSLAPGEWSFSTYIRPFVSAGNGFAGSNRDADGAAEVHAVEEILWAMLAGAKNYNTSTYAYDAADTGPTAVTTPAAAQSVISFAGSNSSTLGTFNIYFVLGNANQLVYKLEGCTANEASIDFDIDGIATVAWSGNSNQVVDFTANTSFATSAPTSGAGSAVGDVHIDTDDSNKLQVVLTANGGSHTPVIREAVLDTTNFIRNRLTQLTIVPASTDPDGDSVNELAASYTVTLTGGNITISNNITYITPEELGQVNIPIGHVTGTRAVSGSMTCYLVDDTSNATSSRDLFNNLQALQNVVTNDFTLTFKIGGSTASTKRLEVAMPNCHLEIPTHSVEDVISLETNFMSLPTTIDDKDEVTLTYKV
tara:strand:- start:3717 stop:4994 length:1278 start_codon:yes stop_codon:yes gene_type:complete